jgi:TRAP-type C4-dicarboxylate transport system permease small subunit
MLFERVSKVAGVASVAVVQLCNVALVVMTALIGILVLTRNFMGFSFAWTEEATKAMLVWISMLGAAVLTLKDDHIGIDSPVRRFGPKVEVAVRLICRLLILAFLVILLQQSWLTAFSRMATRMPVLGVSLFWVYISIPIASVLMMLASLIRIWDDVLQLMGKRPIPKHDNTLLQNTGV